MAYVIIRSLGWEAMANGPMFKWAAGQVGVEEGKGFFPQDFAGHDQAGDDADVHGRFVPQQRPNLLHPAADEGDAVHHKSHNPVGERGEARTAGNGQGQHNPALQHHQSHPGSEILGGIRRHADRRYSMMPPVSKTL